MREWRLGRQFPRSEFFYIWNGYRYGSSGHWRDEGSLGSLRRRAKRYLRNGGREVVIEIRSLAAEPYAPNVATITYSRWATPVVKVQLELPKSDGVN